MKTAWLPEMPINVATLLLDPRLAHESDAKIGRLIRVLSRAWIDGELTRVPASVSDLANQFWPDYAELRAKLHEKHRALSDAGARGGRSPREREVESPALSPPSSPVSSPPESTHPHPHPKTKKIHSPDKPARESWITPFAEAWSRRTGGEMAIERALKPLAKLRKRYGPERALAAWGYYLAETEVPFLSVSHFAAKFGQWDKSGGEQYAAVYAGTKEWLNCARCGQDYCRILGKPDKHSCAVAV